MIYIDALIDQLLSAVHAHEYLAMWIGAGLLVVAGFFLTGPHGRWTR